MRRSNFFDTTVTQVQIAANREIDFSEIDARIKLVGVWGRDTTLGIPVVHIRFPKECEEDISSRLKSHADIIRINDELTARGEASFGEGRRMSYGVAE